VDVWNSLPADVVTTYNQFKRGLLNVNLDKFLTVIEKLTTGSAMT
jgi:hypothetical protein